MSVDISEVVTTTNVLGVLDDLRHGLLLAKTYKSEPALVNLGTDIVQLDLVDAEWMLDKLGRMIGVLSEALVNTNLSKE